MKIKDIIIYPIKSLGGININRALCTEMGLEFDRRMMLADARGQFISQREYPILATIGAKLEKDGFKFYDKCEESNFIDIPLHPDLFEENEVQVWDHAFKAKKLDKNISSWFETFVKKEVFLYKMTEESERYKPLNLPPNKIKLSMADGYPYLIVSEASLADLNDRLKHPVDMNRFRANIIIEGCQAYTEETLNRIKLGRVAFSMVKPCARCSIITIDQKTGKKLVEPLKTLSLYKKKGNKVYFGMNAIALEAGEIKLGDLVSSLI